MRFDSGKALLLAILLLAQPSFAKERPRPLAGLDAQVARAMQEFAVPGMAVAVVKDGEVVHAKGYGVRQLGAPEPVDGDTLFGIASNTKAFTCAALAMLAEEGKLNWDDPVTKHLPEFQMYDPWVTRELTVRDLVTHRAGLGLGQGDLMWWPATDLSRAEIVTGVRHLKPVSSLRSRYAYNNVLYVVAGEVVSRVAGTSWDEFVRGRVFAPLGMSHSNTSVSASGSNVATPHIELAGRASPVAPMRADNVGAAAAINSSASDMARWLRMLLECGRGAGERDACLLKAASIQALWSAQIARATPAPPPGLEALRAAFSAYGLGFDLRDYRGRKLASHTGGLPGYVSQVALVPEERLGLVVLTNQESGAAFRAVMQGILDDYLGAPTPAVDWVAAFHRQAEELEGKARVAVAKAEAARAKGTSPSLPLAGYAGRYRDPWYGDVTIELGAAGLVLSMTRTPGMRADLEHWQHDSFVARWRERYMSDSQPADAYVSFALLPDGNVERVSMTPVSPAIDFSFDFQDLRLVPVSTPAAGPAQAR